MKAPKNNIGYKWLNLGRLVPPLVRSSGDEASSERMLVVKFGSRKRASGKVGDVGAPRPKRLVRPGA